MLKKILVYLFNKKYSGKELYFCHRIYEDLIFLPHVVHKCCHHQVLDKEPPIVSKDPKKKITLTSYIFALDRIMSKNQTKKPECGNCRLLKKQIVPKFIPHNFFKFITISHFTKCNSNCIYSELQDKTKEPQFSMLPQLEHFVKENMLYEDCFFNWGGGEPTICPEFNELCTYIDQNNRRQGINSSGIVFSETILNGMKKKSMNIQISPDSGTKETYFEIKRQNNFDKMWENIKKYAQYPDKLYVKYIFFSGTAKENDVREFVRKCVEAGVKIIVIDCELNSVTNPLRPFGEITQEIVDLAILMKHLAIENNIRYEISYQWKDEHIELIKNG